MLSSPLHAKMIEQFFVEREMPYKLLHQLISVDKQSGKATFQTSYMLNGKRVDTDEFVEKGI